MSSFSRLATSLCPVEWCAAPGNIEGSWWIRGDERVKQSSLVAHRSVSLEEEEEEEIEGTGLVLS